MVRALPVRLFSCWNRLEIFISQNMWESETKPQRSLCVERAMCKRGKGSARSLAQKQAALGVCSKAQNAFVIRTSRAAGATVHCANWAGLLRCPHHHASRFSARSRVYNLIKSLFRGNRDATQTQLWCVVAAGEVEKGHLAKRKWRLLIF